MEPPVNTKTDTLHVQLCSYFLRVKRGLSVLKIEDVSLECYYFFIIIIKTSCTGPSGKSKVVYKLLSQPHEHLR